MLSDAVDSFYEHVKARILTVNPSRIVAGILNAQDWPSKNVKVESFYLLVLASTPATREYYSQAVPVKFHNVQWVWLIKGTDLVPGVRQANRGDKYRTMQAMKGELINGHYPGFTEKFSWSLDGNGIWVSTPKDPVETILWNPIELHEKLDKASGVYYGTGAVRIVDQTDTITQ